MIHLQKPEGFELFNSMWNMELKIPGMISTPKVLNIEKKQILSGFFLLNLNTFVAVIFAILSVLRG